MYPLQHQQQTITEFTGVYHLQHQQQTITEFTGFVSCTTSTTNQYGVYRVSTKTSTTNHPLQPKVLTNILTISASPNFLQFFGQKGVKPVKGNL